MVSHWAARLKLNLCWWTVAHTLRRYDLTIASGILYDSKCRGTIYSIISSPKVQSSPTATTEIKKCSIPDEFKLWTFVERYPGNRSPDPIHRLLERPGNS
jgi:hypothetical protein